MLLRTGNIEVKDLMPNYEVLTIYEEMNLGERELTVSLNLLIPLGRDFILLSIFIPAHD